MLRALCLYLRFFQNSIIAYNKRKEELINFNNSLYMSVPRFFNNNIRATRWKKINIFSESMTYDFSKNSKKCFH